ncbi:hypothetical protein ACJX0J_019005, partial [Zea mays]
ANVRELCCGIKLYFGDRFAQFTYSFIYGRATKPNLLINISSIMEQKQQQGIALWPKNMMNNQARVTSDMISQALALDPIHRPLWWWWLVPAAAVREDADDGGQQFPAV